MIRPLFLGLIVCYLGSVQVSSARQFSVTLKVVDDMGHPVAGAEALVTIERFTGALRGGESEVKSATTDDSGVVSISGNSDRAGIIWGVRAADHYVVWSKSFQFVDKTLFRWQPWNPTIPVVLKRIRNPVPMYAARWMGSLPVLDQWIGFDMELADWVEPYGKGQISDVDLLGTGEFLDDRNVWGRVTMRFVGEGNGLLLHRVEQQKGVSVPRLPYEAPDSGYEKEYTWERVWRDDPSAHNGIYFRDGQDKAENFFIRVRSTWDDQGNLTSAWYGKIHGPTAVFTITRLLNGGPWRIALAFTYLVNPDGTRNVEFDQKRNLLNKMKRSRDFGYEGIEP